MTLTNDIDDDDVEEEETKFCIGCGLELDPGDLWCGIDPACRYQAQLMYGDVDD